MITCIYHGNCADGFGAAWVVRKFFKENNLGEIDFIPGHYGKAPPDVAGKAVILVDYSYKRPVLLEMAKVAESILILDHHKTAVEDLVDLPDNVQCTFDMNRSGAMMAWDHFFEGQPAPQLIKHIQDRDLWLFKLEGTREIQANVFSYPYEFEAWDTLMSMDVKEHMVSGAAIERKHHKDIGELVGVTKRRMNIGGYDVPVANLPYTLSSDAGHLMCTGEPFAACYYDTENSRVFSVRSTDEGVDVSEIAKQYGGGGHRNASGFRVPFSHELGSNS